MTLLEKIKDQHNYIAWNDFVYCYRSYIYSVIKRMGLSDSYAHEGFNMMIEEKDDKEIAEALDPYMSTSSV